RVSPRPGSEKPTASAISAGCSASHTAGPISQRRSRTLWRHSGVVDLKLHRVAAAPGIAAQMTGDVHRTAPHPHEEFAERQAADPERDRPQLPLSEDVGESDAKVPGTNRLGMNDSQRWKRE